MDKVNSFGGVRFRKSRTEYNKDVLYEVECVESFYDAEGCVRKRVIAKNSFSTADHEFWYMILDMMKEYHKFRIAAEHLEKALGKFGRV